MALNNSTVIKGQWWQVTDYGGPKLIYVGEDQSPTLASWQFVEIVSEEPVEFLGRCEYLRVRQRDGQNYRILREGLVHQNIFCGGRTKLAFKSRDLKPLPTES